MPAVATIAREAAATDERGDARKGGGIASAREGRPRASGVLCCGRASARPTPTAVARGTTRRGTPRRQPGRHRGGDMRSFGRGDARRRERRRTGRRDPRIERPRRDRRGVVKGEKCATDAPAKRRARRAEVRFSPTAGSASVMRRGACSFSDAIADARAASNCGAAKALSGEGEASEGERPNRGSVGQ